MYDSTQNTTLITPDTRELSLKELRELNCKTIYGDERLTEIIGCQQILHPLATNLFILTIVLLGFVVIFRYKLMKRVFLKRK